MRKVGFLCLSLFAVLLISGIIWGQDVTSLLGGTASFSDYEALVYDTTSTKNLKHAYVNADIEMITGSYAQHGEIKENEMENKTVYYLMPIDNGNYFITVIAHGAITQQLDEMEQAFYDSIGQEEKEYPEKLTVNGGFKYLQEEEKALALDYFHGYDEKIETMDDLATICSPYALVVDQINNITTSSLWMLWMLWIIIFIIFIITAVLYQSGYLLKTLKNDINNLSASAQDHLDEDYRKATPMEALKIGEYCLYKKELLSMRVYDYGEFIWLYQKEILGKKHRLFEVCAYDKQGKQYILWKGSQQETAEKLVQRIFNHCSQALLGYETFIYEYWEENPQGLYDKLKELSLIKEKLEKEKKKEKKTRTRKNKHEKKKKKRQVRKKESRK